MAKDARLAVRLNEHQLDQIRQAADTAGQTVSDFVVRTLTSEAAHVLADRRIFALDDAAWTHLNELIERPIAHKPRLEKLMSAEPAFAPPKT